MEKKTLFYRIIGYKFFQPIWGAIFFVIYLILFLFSCKSIDLALMTFWLGWSIMALMGSFQKISSDEFIDLYKKLADRANKHYADVVEENGKHIAEIIKLRNLNIERFDEIIRLNEELKKMKDGK